jgi:hypothetical protein
LGHRKGMNETGRRRVRRPPRASFARRHGRAALAGLLLAVALGLGVAGFAWTEGRFDQERREKSGQAASYDEANRQQMASAPSGVKGDPKLERPADSGTIAWDQGVFETQEAPIPKGILRVTSMWGQTIGQHHFSVYAGVSISKPGQGMIVVQTYTLDGRHLSDQDYATPARAGAVRIVSARGHRLDLESDSGVRFVFDFDSRRFV